MINLLLSRLASISPLCCFRGFRSSSPPPVSTTRDLAVANEVHSILSTAAAVESSLEALAPFLNASIVNAVIEDQPSFLLGFRFFVWAMRRKRLRSWFSHNFMIQALTQSPDRFDAAWDLFEQLRESGEEIRPLAFVVLISAYERANMDEKAVETFGRMQEFQCLPNTFTYNTIIRILIEKEVILLAMAVYNQMVKSDCQPSQSSYGILINGLCKAGKNQDALYLLDEMTQKGISPNMMIYTIVLSGHCQADRLDDAYKLFRQMKEDGYVPDAVSCNTLLSGFCKRGRVDEAFEIINEEGFELNLFNYSCLIDGLFGVGRFDDACKYYEEMLVKNIVPDRVMYNIMINGYCEAGRLNEALGFLSEMVSKGVLPDTISYNILIKGACHLCLIDKARSLKLEISKQGDFPNSGTYTVMICGLCKEGLVKEAKEIFDEMEKLGCHPTARTFNALIHGLCRAGDIDSARLLFHKMEIGKKPFLFLRLSQGAEPITSIQSLEAHVQRLCDESRTLDAYKLLRELGDSGVVPDVYTYNTLINGLCKNNDINGAIRVFKEMQIKGCSPNVHTYSRIIDGLWRSNREQDAFSLFEKIKTNGPAPNREIYNSLMQAMCWKRRAWQALTLWMEFISRYNNATPQLVQQHFEQGSSGEGVKILIKMELQHKIFDPIPYNTMIIGFCRAGKLNVALDIYDVLGEHKIDITGPCCMILVGHLCRAGKILRAMDIFFYALDKGYMLSLYVCNELITQLCYRNKRRSAGMIAYRLKLAGYEEDMYMKQTTRDLLYGISQR